MTLSPKGESHVTGLGITRDSVLPFTRNPARHNIYQHVVTVSEIHPR